MFVLTEKRRDRENSEKENQRKEEREGRVKKKTNVILERKKK